MKNDLCERLFKYAVDVIRLLKTLPSTVENNVIRYQLAKAATSSGANYEEAQAGVSRAEFNHKVDLSLKEMRESNYWLRVIDELDIGEINLRKHLVRESEELKKILGSIATKTSS